MLQKIAFYPSIALILLGMARTGAHAQPPRNRPPNFRPGPPRGPVVINHYENNGSGLAASALGFGAGLLVGSAASSPPPPSTVIVTQPTPIITQQIPSTVVQVHTPPSDAIGSALKMLNSHWASTRRDGAILLGRQKATQAIGPLMDRLRNDKDASVRKTAAWSLAEIGDTTALEYLEKTSQFDKSPEVRAASKTAYQRLVEKVAIVTPAQTAIGKGASAGARDPLAQPPLPPVPGASPPISRTQIKRNSSPSPAIPPGPSPFAGTVSPTPALEAPLSLSPPVQPLNTP